MSTLCTAWILRPKSGAALGFTDHDDRLQVADVACVPQSGFRPSAMDTHLGFSHDNGELEGVIDDLRLTSQALSDGQYHGAGIETYAVDWTDPSLATLTRTLTITSITRDDRGQFIAEVVGLSAKLETVSGEVVSRLCRARFGDAACGLSREDFPDGTDCPRTFAACAGFSNEINYRGFPHLIGDDALVQGLNEALPRDGGSRYPS